jgi:2-methylcitrate dehydratase PrpD
MTDHPAVQLAEKICSVTYPDFPAATIHKAKIHILDTLGVALAGSGSAETRLVLDGLGLRDEPGCAPVWGTPLRLNPRAASFVNGVSAHAYELDDTGGCDHSGAVVLPAVLAALARSGQPVSGQRLLTCILMGYEVGRRLLEAAGGYEVHNGLGWHSTGTCGAFGAAAAAGLLLGLDAPGIASALGIACSYAGGTWSFIHDGSQTKKLHAGRAAEGGLSAAMLAASSFSGPLAVFDASSWGSYLTTFARGEGDAALLTSAFGENWRLNRCSIKPYATCRGTHSAIDAVDLLLTRNGLRPDDVVGVEVDISGFQAGMCGGTTVTTRAEAQMSLPYAVAARLTYGKVFLAELERDAWAAPAIGQWLSRTEVRIDETMKDEDEPAITLVTMDGRRFRECVEHPLGSPANPLSDDRVIGKFIDLAADILPPARISDIRDFVLDLDRQPDVSRLTSLLQHP